MAHRSLSAHIVSVGTTRRCRQQRLKDNSRHLLRLHSLDYKAHRRPQDGHHRSAFGTGSSTLFLFPGHQSHPLRQVPAGLAA
ncbi:hypothetical protein FA95DRAFT_1554387 [Auriscalpium vulgare]|uniref:Uncharacterized protein n=1 Tax=Auriscalpium vulgare TaxID=40419 RepID=A0ACB8S5P7_9AGAM|nr:hypothetical protein FA95DRAFT_1554387 [Auriscalpium vulgare]